MDMAPSLTFQWYIEGGGGEVTAVQTIQLDLILWGSVATPGNNPPLDNWALQGHQLPCLAFQWSVEGGRQLQYGVQYNSIYYLNQCTNGALVTLIKV